MITRRLGRSPDFEGAADFEKFLSTFELLKVRTVGWKEAPQEGTLSPTLPGPAFQQVSLVRMSVLVLVCCQTSVSVSESRRG